MPSRYDSRARPSLRLGLFSAVRSEREAERLRIVIASFVAWPGLAHLTGIARHPF